MDDDRLTPDLPNEGRRRWRAGWVVSVVLGGAALVRLGALQGDLWLDEIWSLAQGLSIQWPWEILTRLRHDNNHPLNTLYLYLLGAGRPDWSYRLLSYVAGLVIIAGAGLVASELERAGRTRQHSNLAAPAGFFAMVLFAGAYLMIHFGTEARGYAPALAAAFLGWWALLRGDSEPSSRWTLGYWLAMVTAILAHPTGLYVLAGAVAWSAVRWKGELRRLLRWQAVPVVAAGLYIFGFLLHLSIGGGPRRGLLEVLGETAAYALGIPGVDDLAPPILQTLAPLAFAALVFGWWKLRRRANLWIFDLTAAVLAPAAVLVATRHPYLFVRYFLVSVALALLVAAAALARGWARGGWTRAVCVVLCVLYLVGNAVPTARLLRDGRGQYSAALQYLHNASEGPVITVSSNHDFRNRTVLAYYADRLPPGKELVYLAASEMPPEGAEWVLFHALDHRPPGPVLRGGDSAVSYRYETTFPYAALSGWDWHLYHRANPAGLTTEVP